MRNIGVVCNPINMTKSLPKRPLLMMMCSVLIGKRKKSQQCSATLLVRIKHDTKFIRCCDPCAKRGLFAIIMIDNRHSHLLENAEAWKWLKRTDQTND